MKPNNESVQGQPSNPENGEAKPASGSESTPRNQHEPGGGLDAPSCSAPVSESGDQTGLGWESNPLEELRKTGLWVDDETYIDYELIEHENPIGDACSIKPNSTSDIEGVIKSLKHLFRARERDVEAQRLQVLSNESERISPCLKTRSECSL